MQEGVLDGGAGAVPEELHGEVRDERVLHLRAMQLIKVLVDHAEAEAQELASFAVGRCVSALHEAGAHGRHLEIRRDAALRQFLQPLNAHDLFLVRPLQKIAEADNLEEQARLLRRHGAPVRVNVLKDEAHGLNGALDGERVRAWVEILLHVGHEARAAARREHGLVHRKVGARERRFLASAAWPGGRGHAIHVRAESGAKGEV
mmetsp:Transcript_14866/g.43682  ORF Transcript_14866/g.43682 Transcript_14866/m.43682 type:complete len:204 (+) Transcript_14866:320-931(+)